ncbi:CBS domain-containing protein [Marinobacter bryozoorum]|uniref:CBS domain-containing protein n=1 Tax=Marinobacter bryozoorum TaxID=256324 RepID=UPI0020052CB1|nr:CBS domain-containing protein [Marinobacter bryozoorum]MCK7546302.1 CBS domain-containing protein [Marinobacter bryozoorum]
MSNSLRFLVSRPSGGVFRLLPNTITTPLSSDGPATKVLKDFARDYPVTVRAAMGIREARQRLYNHGSTFAVVINAKEEVTGMLALKDLMGALPLSLANQRGGSIDDITAQDVMRPIWSLPVIDYSRLQTLKVEDLVALFKELHTDFLLVTDADATYLSEQFVRGLLSSDDLGQKLGVNLTPDPRPESFSDIVHAVRGSSG